MEFKILHFIHTIHNPMIDKVMIFFTRIGDVGLIWIIMSFLLIGSKKYKKEGTFLLCTLIVNAFLGEGILKHMIKRGRPFNTEDMELLIKAPLSYSFPSGHTSSSFAIYTVSKDILKKYKNYILFLAIGISFSRIYLFVHYPSDILGGIFLGILSGKIVLFYYKKI